MRFFITGATGYIGSALVRELVDGHHEANGLVRSPQKAKYLESLGGRPVPGTLEDPASYAEAASDCDVLVHLAFDTSPDHSADRSAIETLLKSGRLSGRPRSVIYTAGVWSLSEGLEPPGDENAPTTGAAKVSEWRIPHEYVALNGATDMIASAVIRPGMVYGGKGGFINGFFKSAKEKGAAEYVGDGQNRWSVVHVEDVARLYRLVGEKRARGIFHAVENDPLQVKEIARMFSEAAGAGGATRTISLEEARTKMGAAADALASDRPAAARRSRELGWRAEWEMSEMVGQAYRDWVS
jgi:nucleoside-diphosphate-sugar epimerase